MVPNQIIALGHLYTYILVDTCTKCVDKSACCFFFSNVFITCAKWFSPFTNEINKLNFPKF